MFKKAVLIILALIFVSGLFTACSSGTTTAPVTTKPVTTTQAPAATTTSAPTTAAPTTTTPPPASVTITDQYNRTVTVKAYPQRIISLSPAHTEILFALGLGDRIVGVSDYSDYPEAATKKENVGSYDSPNIEKIISLNPDLVMATEEHQEAVEQLTKYKIPVVALNPKSVKEVLNTVNLIGKVTGTDKEAAALAGDMQSRMDKITAMTTNLRDYERPRVLVVIWHEPIFTVGAGTFHDELIQMAGGVNIAHYLSGYPIISLETIIADNPQIIIAGVGMGTGMDASLQAMLTEPRLALTDARLNNWVYGANMDIISRPGPRLVEALEILFKLIHPELQ